MHRMRIAEVVSYTVGRCKQVTLNHIDVSFFHQSVEVREIFLKGKVRKSSPKSSSLLIASRVYRGPISHDSFVYRTVLFGILWLILLCICARPNVHFEDFKHNLK